MTNVKPEDTPKPLNSESPSAIKEPNAGTSSRPIRTPMYAALNAPRYHRQNIIKDIQLKRNIQHKEEYRLICYVSGSAAGINRDDTVAFGDLLYPIPKGTNIDLLLHTPGGDFDAAEKLILMVRKVVDTGKLRIVVPDLAKSSGTLMALAADSVVMSDSSELGPIDPQIDLDDGRGNLIRHSVLSYLDAYDTQADALRKDPSDPVARLMLAKLDPATVKNFESVKRRIRDLAESLLRQFMFKTRGNVTQTAAELMNVKKWPSHAQMIGHSDAAVIGLSVEYLDPKSDEWQSYWQLYCLQRLEVRDRFKLFESDFVSFPLDTAT